MNLGRTRLRGRPRNRWKDAVREDGRIVGGEGWQEKLHNVLYTIVKNPTITETITLNRLHWFGHVQRMEENRIPKRALYMNLGTGLRVRPSNRWQDDVREDG